jgi:single stranded DNA-binding protein
MQIVQLIGHIGRDAETKHIGERDYLSFSVACTEKRNNEEQTSWYSILYPLQESIAPYLKKGQQVYVMGRLSAKIFQSNNSFGIDLSVFAQTLQLCGGKKEEATAPAASPAGQTNQATYGSTVAGNSVAGNQVPSYQTVAQQDAPFPPQENEDSDGLPF